MDYNKIKARWSRLINDPATRKMDVEYHVVYAVIRGKDWRKCFSSFTNKYRFQNTISNLRWYGLDYAKWLFGDLVDVDELKSRLVRIDPNVFLREDLPPYSEKEL